MTLWLPIHTSNMISSGYRVKIPIQVESLSKVKTITWLMCSFSGCLSFSSLLIVGNFVMREGVAVIETDVIRLVISDGSSISFIWRVERLYQNAAWSGFSPVQQIMIKMGVVSFCWQWTTCCMVTYNPTLSSVNLFTCLLALFSYRAFLQRRCCYFFSNMGCNGVVNDSRFLNLQRMLVILVNQEWSLLVLVGVGSSIHSNKPPFLCRWDGIHTCLQVEVDRWWITRGTCSGIECRVELQQGSEEQSRYIWNVWTSQRRKTGGQLLLKDNQGKWEEKESQQVSGISGIVTVV